MDRDESNENPERFAAKAAMENSTSIAAVRDCGSH
jgi:hypothetical protein